MDGQVFLPTVFAVLAPFSINEDKSGDIHPGNLNTDGARFMVNVGNIVSVVADRFFLSQFLLRPIMKLRNNPRLFVILIAASIIVGAGKKDERHNVVNPFKIVPASNPSVCVQIHDFHVSISFSMTLPIRYVVLPARSSSILDNIFSTSPGDSEPIRRPGVCRSTDRGV